MVTPRRLLRRLVSATGKGVVGLLIVTGVAVSGIRSSTAEAAVVYNGKIAFVSNRDGNDEIYVMDADGSNQTRLTFNDGSDSSPMWSPDGAQIAFTSVREGNTDIYVMDADGSNVRRLSDHFHFDYMRGFNGRVMTRWNSFHATGKSVGW